MNNVLSPRIQVESLIYYDGPILSLAVDQESRLPIIQYWVDRDELRNVWADFWLSLEDAKAFMASELPMREALSRATAIRTYETYDTATPVNLRDVQFKDIVDLLPEPHIILSLRPEFLAATLEKLAACLAALHAEAPR